MSESAISHQLRLLRNHNMVRFRRDGKMAYYSLADQHVIQLIETEVQHARE
jgi:DNA-binding transcriptional ArsR family regulator